MFNSYTKSAAAKAKFKLIELGSNIIGVNPYNSKIITASVFVSHLQPLITSLSASTVDGVQLLPSLDVGRVIKADSGHSNLLGTDEEEQTVV